MTKELEVGEVYMAYGGEVVTIVSKNGAMLFPFLGSNNRRYRPNGEYDHQAYSVHDLDTCRSKTVDIAGVEA